MKVEGEYVLEGPQDVVWQTLLDPVVLASVLPGCEKLELVAENEYDGALNIKVGPVQGQFQGRVKLEDIRPPEAYTMRVDGRGAPGFVKATGHLALAGDGARTRLTYDADAQVGGRLASVGQRLIESSAKAIIKQSLDGLNAAVRARAAAGAAPAGGGAAGPAAPAAMAPAPPSQARFAASVAREVAKDLVPKPVRYALLAVAAVLVLWLFLALLT
jgi:carbon monoxide dehydrogenase subunit G